MYAHATETNGNTRRNLQSLLGAGLIVVGIFYITKEKAFPGYWAVLPTAGTLLIIGAGKQAWLNRAVLSNRVLVWFGLISFPLYLWHWPLLSFARIVEGQALPFKIRIGCCFISIVLAWLTYKLIEKPLRFGKHGNAKTVTLMLLMVAVGYVGYNCYKRDGLEFRLPDAIKGLMSHQKFLKVMSNDWREHRCFLDAKEDTFKPECVDSGLKGPLVYLWGDSHAAALYAGLRDMQKTHGYRIAQFTQSSCPPWKEAPCSDSYPENISRIKLLKPDIIVLHAQWAKSNYQNYLSLSDTLKELKALGVPEIVVLGAVPEWSGGLPQNLYNLYKKDRVSQLPERTNYGVNPEIWDIDKAIELIAKQNQVKFVSAREILCNLDGCLAVMDGKEPSSYDTGHLSPPASKLVAASLMTEIFKSGIK